MTDGMREDVSKEITEDVYVDPHRGMRVGVPEVVLALGKSEKNLLTAVERLLAQHPVLVTKTSPDQIQRLKFFSREHSMEINESASAVTIGGRWDSGIGRCAVISAGAADNRTAEEAAFSLHYLGVEPVRAFDQGVAGLHRLDDILAVLKKERDMGAIVVAGMEGALPSVVAGQLKQPVVAVPTSVGYGSSFEGMAALLGMMNSCVPGMVVVNIDNGFGAASSVYRMMKTWKKE